MLMNGGGLIPTFELASDNSVTTGRSFVFSNTSNVLQVDSGSTLNLSGSAGSLINGGFYFGVQKTGAGTLQLSNSSTYSNNLVISQVTAGTFLLAGNSARDGQLGDRRFSRRSTTLLPGATVQYGSSNLQQVVAGRGRISA